MREPGTKNFVAKLTTTQQITRLQEAVEFTLKATVSFFPILTKDILMKPPIVR